MLINFWHFIYLSFTNLYIYVTNYKNVIEIEIIIKIMKMWFRHLLFVMLLKCTNHIYYHINLLVIFLAKKLSFIILQVEYES